MYWCGYSISLIICRNFDWHLHYSGEPINTKKLFAESRCTAGHIESVARTIEFTLKFLMRNSMPWQKEKATTPLNMRQANLTHQKKFTHF